MLIPLLVGASVTYLDKPPTAAALIPALARVQPTVMLAVPLIIEKIYRQDIPEFNRRVLIRGLYKIPTIRKRLNRIAGKKLYQTFGGKLKMFCIGGLRSPPMLNGSSRSRFSVRGRIRINRNIPLVTGTNQLLVKFRSAGKILPAWKLRSLSQIRKPAREKFWLRSNVMKGYYKDEEKTKDVFTADGWFKSGDLGVINKEGYLFIKGDLKTLLSVLTEKISTRKK